MDRRKGRSGVRRKQGGRELDETVLVPAGTILESPNAKGKAQRQVLEHDTIFPSDCVGESDLLIRDDLWEFEDVSWDEWGY